MYEYILLNKFKCRNKTMVIVKCNNKAICIMLEEEYNKMMFWHKKSSIKNQKNEKSIERCRKLA